MENELADTIYKDLPDSMRRFMRVGTKLRAGKGRVRGSRGGQNERENLKKKKAKENNRARGEESDSSEEGEYNC